MNKAATSDMGQPLQGGFLRAKALFERFSGPKRCAALAGALIALAQPPFGFLPGLVGYAWLLWLLDREQGPKPLRRAFAIGWWSGFAYFLISCFWVAEAFLVDARSHGWMAPIAVTLLPSGIALFWGAAFVLYRRFCPEGWSRWLWFVGLFCAFETLRGTILTGFPWNPAGATWEAGSAMSQIVSITGIYGLGLITVLAFSSPAISRLKGRGVWPVAVSVLLLVLVFAFGAQRLHRIETGQTDTLIRIVQPNVEQRAKWTVGALRGVFNDYVSMSKAPVDTDRLQSVAKSVVKSHPDIVIWPEGALPASADALFSAQSWTAEGFSTLLKPDQALIMGAYHSDYVPEKGTVWRNALLVLQQKGPDTHVSASYSKFKLVPFGEFLPMESLLESFGFKQLVHIGDSYTAGPRTASVEVEGIDRFLPLICYEGLFPGLSTGLFSSSDMIQRPKWIVNISNDAWFGPTTGPRQHFNLSGFRAIEEGLPMVRSTPTGISVVLDPLGRIVKGSKLDIGESGYRDVWLPESIKPTFYSANRHLYLLVVMLFCLIPTVITLFVRKAKPHAPDNDVSGV
ncbi:apolipoprotein N-acyltransferase [Asticcacaulis tiandongensis]|uniref:apolipoprotein N-acyltransferase n=1 Tax=Asticcacaulis tiandongensis TaxID=2565365 RepID=UPI001FE6BF58|nr:apolipoprotein N-acyltransferase [Asticcacaulis tiandongensis]